MYKPKYFKVEELVDPETFHKFGSNSLSVCFDDRILYTLDRVREYFNKSIIVNNWLSDGNFKFRGFRPFGNDSGATFSQHKFGRAIDFDVVGLTAEEVRKEIKKYENLDCFKYITRLEDNVNWVHMDCGNYDRTNGIILFKV